MKFLNKTIYNRKALEKLNLTVNWALTGRSKPLIRVLGMMIPLAIFGSGLYLFREHGMIPIAVAELALGTFLLLWMPFYHRFQAWAASKLMLKGNPEYTLDFNEKGYTVSSTTAYGAATDRADSSTLWKLCETREYFILLLNKHTGYIMDKDGFVQGSAGEFRQFLAGETGLAFQYFDL